MKFTTKQIVFVAVMTALCCILGPLSIPIGTVPVSLQVLAVLLCVYVLGMGLGTLSVVLYLVLGLVGLPIFSGFQGGPGKLFGPTGGYLIGFIFLALIGGFFIDRSKSMKGVKKILFQVVGIILGLAVCYAFGTIWFMVTMEVGFVAALGMCVIPFLIFDAAKIVISVILGNAVRKGLAAAKLITY